MKLQESGENYLEAILQLEEQNGIVRSVDIAEKLGVSKPSVSRAMGVLKKAGYINQETYGNVLLTEKGREKAKAVYHRHTVLTRFLVEVLGVEAGVAEEDACRMEHVLSDQTMEKIGNYMDE